MCKWQPEGACPCCLSNLLTANAHPAHSVGACGHDPTSYRAKLCERLLCLHDMVLVGCCDNDERLESASESQSQQSASHERGLIFVERELDDIGPRPGLNAATSERLEKDAVGGDRQVPTPDSERHRHGFSLPEGHAYPSQHVQVAA
jgi:hypothetical protein